MRHRCHCPWTKKTLCRLSGFCFSALSFFLYASLIACFVLIVIVRWPCSLWRCRGLSESLWLALWLAGIFVYKAQTVYWWGGKILFQWIDKQNLSSYNLYHYCSLLHTYRLGSAAEEVSPLGCSEDFSCVCNVIPNRLFRSWSHLVAVWRLPISSL